MPSTTPSRYPTLSLAQLLDALRVCLWHAYGAGEVFPHVGTSDARTYTCTVKDLDDGTTRTDAPVVVSTTERDAVEGMLASFEDADVEAALAEAPPPLATLADPIPVSTRIPAKNSGAITVHVGLPVTPAAPHAPEPPLARFAHALAGCANPLDCASTWRTHRAALSTLDKALVDAAWSLCVRRAEEVGTHRGMRRWLKSEIARQDRRETAKGRARRQEVA